jgi:hypothetical protein
MMASSDKANTTERGHREIFLLVVLKGQCPMAGAANECHMPTT